jgi:hypothetical protein
MPSNKKVFTKKAHKEICKPKKQLTNHFLIALDRSGSMGSIRYDAVNAFNESVRTILKGANESGQKSTVTLTTFGGDITQHFFCQDAEELRALDISEYRAHGNTPMFDAVGTSVQRLSVVKGANDDDTSFVVIVITDGAENASKSFSPESFCEMLRNGQNTDRWSFVFMVPPGSRNVCHSFGIPDGNIQEWEATSRGMAVASNSLCNGITNYYQNRTLGNRNTTKFFETDLHNVTTKEVKSQLTNVCNNVRILDVPRECEIRPFCEMKGIRYEKGRAFYQLTKTETIQFSKQIILVERGKPNVYMGRDARSILGLPDFDVKVKPGDHGKWDIFVQSMSVNRKLVRGTKIVYVLN